MYDDQKMSYSQRKSFLQLLKRKKITKSMKRTSDVVVAVDAAVQKVRQRIRQHSLLKKALAKFLVIQA